MNIRLTLNEARVLGSLIEKGITTPEYYPLSINAITSACNQKSNRDPVMHLSEVDVQEAMDSLIKKHLISQRSTAGSRVTKYAHRFAGTLSKEFDFLPQELAVLCVLLLRGPQTAGKIRSRSSRLYEFGGLEEVEKTLTRLSERTDGPYVTELSRQPGRRENRFAHLLCGDVIINEDEILPPEPALSRGHTVDNRLTRLEQEVETLREEMEDLKNQMKEISGSSE